MGPGLVPEPGSKFKRDRDQSSGPEITGTGTNHRDQKWPGTGPVLVSVPVPVPWRSLLASLFFRLLYWDFPNMAACTSDPQILIFLSGVTILLSLTVFLNMVAETMPVTSDNPLLGKYRLCSQTNSTNYCVISNTEWSSNIGLGTQHASLAV